MVNFAARYGDVLTAIDGTPVEPRPFVFRLSDSVLIAFITSTTVSVIGILAIGARWLFRANGAEDGSS